VKVPLTPWRRHVEAWKGCDRCPIHLTRTNVCLGRGALPCDALFVGEAPGPSEDVVGQPFVGPAGHLLDQVIERATVATQTPGTIGMGHNSLNWAFTNLVGCFLLDEDGDKEEPPDESIEACKPRLREFAELCDVPKGKLRLVVAVGSLAFDWLKPGYKHSIKLHRPLSLVPQAPEFGTIHLIQVTHPAAVLRAPMAMRSLMVQRMAVTLRNALEEL